MTQRLALLIAAVLLFVAVAAGAFGAHALKARIDADLLAEVSGRLAPFLARDLAVLDGGNLSIQPGGLPYARTIAALFDPYRQDSVRRFSSAV